MIKKILKFSLIMIFAIGLTSPILAQGRQTGSIKGIIVDTEGNPIPGATITLSGPALFGTQSYVSSDTGKFRFPALPPGENYEIKIEITGFQTMIRKGLICNVGKTTDCRVVLTVSTIEEEVTVTAEAPVVDVESSKMSVNYSSEFISSIPFNRDLYDIQNSIPGAISEGADYRRTSSILGGTLRSNLYALDGVPMNDPATFYAISNINIDAYDEVEFEVGAHPAEVGQTDSAYINIVTKSGGNKFSGGATLYYTGESLAQDMFSEEQISALEVDAPEKYTDYKDISLNIGGPLVKDKIWFFLNGRRLTWEKKNPFVPENRLQKIADANPGLFSPIELQHFDLEHEEWLGFAKLSFQLTNKIKYMGMLHYNHIYEPVRVQDADDVSSYAHTTIYDHENTYTTTHQLNWILDQNTFIDIRGTYINRNYPRVSHPEFAGNYNSYDRKNDIWWGISNYSTEYIRKKMLASISLSKFQDDLLGAGHEFKTGFEFEQTKYHRDRYRLGNPYYSYWRDYNKGNPYYHSSSKKQGRLRIRPVPDKRGQWDRQDNTRRFSGYVQDSITAGNLAINLGIRLDYSYQYFPEQFRPELRYDYGPELLAPGLGPNSLLEALIDQFHQEIGPISPFDSVTTPYSKPVEFFTFSPRVGLVYDIFGDGKTAIKLSYARYYEPVWSSKYNDANIILGGGAVTWRWNDKNGNKFMDLPPTDTYELDDYDMQDPNYTYYVDDLKSPYMDEILAGIEHEIIKDFKLGFQFVWKQNKNIVDDTDLNNGYDPTAKDDKGLIWKPLEVVDPGWDGELGTDDDQTLTVYGLREDRPIPTWRGINPPEAKREYWAFILTFDKRMSNKWQLKGSVLYSSFKGNAEATYSETEGDSELFNNPNAMINAYGPDWFDRPLQIKVMGSYILPYGFVVSAFLQHSSGIPWARTFERVYFPKGFDVQGSYASDVFAETRGSRRESPITNLDLRVEKGFSFGNYGKLNFYIDVFNLGGRSGISLNQNPYGRLRYDETPVRYDLDSNYGLINSVYGVRSFRLGLRYSF
jgi:hypothetical protein